MTERPVSRRATLFSLFALAALPALAAPAPGDSVYRLDANLTDQDGRPFTLASLAGTPVLASMFYTSCDMVCPMIFESVHATLRALPPVDRAVVKVLMVSFDPARDTQAVLKKAAEARACDAQWVLARSDEATVRKVAAVFGVQYRRLANGEFNHSSTVFLLGREGRIAARTGRLGGADPAFVGEVRKASAGA